MLSSLSLILLLHSENKHSKDLILQHICEKVKGIYLQNLL